MAHKSPLNDWLKALSDSFEAGTLVKISLQKPTPAARGVKGIDIRPILVKREKVLSFTTHNPTQDMVKNHPLSEALNMLQKLLPTQFTSAKLHTQTADFLWSNGTLTQQPAKFTEAPSLSHDTAKKHLIPTTQMPTFFHALGLTNAQGQVLSTGQDKVKQINKYIEILDGLIKQLPPKPSLKILDMGAGKGYLTFALYHHLTTTLNLKVEVVGVETRPDMVALCNTIAKQQGMHGLSFAESTIQGFACKGADIIIALHACDTATDDALYKALSANASLIVLAPCCHKQVRRALANPVAQSHQNPLHALLQYGTYAEREADMITDSLRANTLAAAGYTTNLFEFIGGEHTPKNVMITALKRAKPLTPAETKKLQTTRENLEATFGLAGIVLGK